MHILTSACRQPILLDASTLMVGVNKQATDSNFSFENMKELYLEAFFSFFHEILIHRTVWNELDEARIGYISERFLGRNVQIVEEDNLYGLDPQYTTIFNKIAEFDLFRYKRSDSRNKGDVYSLAYAAHHKIPFFSTRDGSIIKAMQEIKYLSNIELVGFE